MIDLERAVPDLERPPTHPGADGRAVRCLGRAGRCGQTLGVVANGRLYVRHEGRELTYDLVQPVWIKCERCQMRQKVGR